MFLVNAQTVYNAVICKLQEDDVPLENLMTILSDSAAYMRGKANGFQAKMKENAQHIVDIDGDLCHHIHNVVKMFAKNVDPDMHLSRLFDDIHNDFSYSADLRADLHEISEVLGTPALLPVERIDHRWLSLLDAAARFKEIVSPLVVFYSAWLTPEDRKLYHSSLVSPHMAKLNKTSKSQVLCTLARLKRKGLTDFGKARKQRIVKKLFHLQPSTMALNSFFCDTLPVFKNFVLAFEHAKPQIHQLYDRILNIYKDVLTKFVKPEYLNSEDILKLNFEEKNLKSPKDVFIGQSADHAVTVVGESRRKEFLQIVKNAYKQTAIYMRSKLPLRIKFLHAVSSIDPKAHGFDATSKAMKQLGRMFPTIIASSEDLTMLDLEVDKYNMTPLPPQAMNLSLDESWSLILPNYPTFGKIVKVCLSIFTGPRVEQSFSFMNTIINPSSNRMCIKTFEAILATKYKLISKSTTSIKHFHRPDSIYSPVDKSMVYHIQTAWRREKEQAKLKSKSKFHKNATAIKPAVKPYGELPVKKSSFKIPKKSQASASERPSFPQNTSASAQQPSPSQSSNPPTVNPKPASAQQPSPSQSSNPPTVNPKPASAQQPSPSQSSNPPTVNPKPASAQQPPGKKAQSSLLNFFKTASPTDQVRRGKRRRLD